MSVYLEDNPPARTQYFSTRRAPISGAIVIHTAENTTDVELPDGGAEGVASFISRRTDAAGSYHSVVDSDSIVHVGKYEWQMFHEGTGGNSWSLGLSFACKASQWLDLPNTWVVPAIRNGAKEAASMAKWVEMETGIKVPAKHLTPEEYRNDKPGFIGHGELDPGRRSDPGNNFPWDYFFGEFVEIMSPTEEIEVEALMFYTVDETMKEVDCLYQLWTGLPAPEAERTLWAQDIAYKIYEKEESPFDTLAFISWTLRTGEVLENE